MKAFIQHIIAFLEAKWVALSHGWIGFATIAVILGTWEGRAVAAIGAVIHAAAAYLHFSSQTVATPATVTTSSPGQTIQVLGTIKPESPIKVIDIPPATEAPKTV